jgi:hypothetical protein
MPKAKHVGLPPQFPHLARYPSSSPLFPSIVLTQSTMDAPTARRALFRGLQFSILPYLFFCMTIGTAGYGRRCQPWDRSDARRASPRMGRRAAGQCGRADPPGIHSVSHAVATLTIGCASTGRAGASGRWSWARWRAVSPRPSSSGSTASASPPPTQDTPCGACASGRR